MEKFRSLLVSVEEASDGLPLIFRVKGALDALTAPKFEKEIFSYLNEGYKNVIINLQELDYISSAGLRALMTTSRKLVSAKGIFVLCTLSKNVDITMANSGFGNYFTIKKTETEALESFIKK
jgi:anti-anti-sigma factor